jgi:serine/threonine protein phosphatase PrpC
MPTTDTRLLLAQDMTDPELLATGQGQVVVVSRRSPEKAGEAANEDAAVVVPLGPDRIVLAVADGVGGLPQGELAARLALEQLVEHLPDPADRDADLRGAILDAFEQANRELLALGTGAATTLAVATIEAGRVRTYHVGDTGVLLVGQRGRTKLDPVWHSPVGYAIEAGLLDEQEAMHHADRHLISNWLGAPDMHIQIGSAVALARRDTLLIATDGLYDNLQREEIVARLRKGPLDDAARDLAETARRRMLEPRPGEPSKLDDLTCVLFRPASG